MVKNVEIHGIRELILCLREGQNIGQDELANGLCTQKFLSKVEMGNSFPDSFLLDALMSRLGRAADKLEYVVSEEDYFFFVKRMEIEESLEAKDYEKLKRQIREYEACIEDEGALHFQYLDMIQAFIVWEKKEKAVECIGYLERAMSRTMSFWKKEIIWKCLMTWIEAGLYLLWAKKVKSGEELERIFENMLDYVNKHWKDEEEKVKIYPFLVVLYSQCFMEKGKDREVDALTKNAISLLTRVNTISNLLRILEIRITALKALKEKGERIEGLERLIKQKEALEHLEIEYGYKESVVGIFTRVKREFYLASEIIRKNRKALGMTQEELSRDICAQETIARIEKGRTPQKTKFQKLSERISWRKKKQSNELGCWDYRLLEKKVEIDWLVSRRRYAEAKKKLEEFPCTDTVETRQYVQYMTVMVEIWLGIQEPEDALLLLKETLEMTLPVSIDKIKSYSLTKQEALVLNGIGNVYNKMGKKEKAIQIYRDILQNYEQSRILPVFQAYGMIVVMGNLAVYLEEMDCFEEALMYMNKVIALELQCRRIGEMPKVMVDIAYTLERQGKEKERRKEMYMQAYYISDLLDIVIIKEIIQKHFNEVYGYCIEE